MAEAEFFEFDFFIVVWDEHDFGMASHYEAISFFKPKN
jgi:hypothetical protein